MKNSRRRTNLREKGITLVALVVTIIVLLILAGITINLALSNNGLIQRAKDASEAYAQAEQNDQNALAYFSDEVKKYVGYDDDGEEATKKITDSGVKPASATAGVTPLSTEKTTDLEDNKGNIVKVPKNFGIAYDSADNVAEGIVIEYTGTSESDPLIGNQYVWIPVGQAITKTNGETMPAITLGRYNFDAQSSSTGKVEGTGEATLVQNASAWATPTNFTPTGETYDVYEYAKNDSRGNSYRNTKANDLEGFINSATSNHGYYIARYEAGSGASNSKPYTQKDRPAWVNITQQNAAIACQNMYEGVTSDLVNSYAWDTAIVYIQKCTGSNDYAKQDRGSNTSKVNTGITGDEKCKINDMAKNVCEWTTESSSRPVYGSYSEICPCVARGGKYPGSFFTAHRSGAISTFSDYDYGFRPLLYV